MGGGGGDMRGGGGGPRMGGGAPGPSVRGDMGPRSGGGAQFSQRGSGNWSGVNRGGRWHQGGRHHRHFRPGVAFGFGGYPYDDYYGGYAYAEPACEYVRVRYVRPNGRVAWRTVERCY